MKLTGKNVTSLSSERTPARENCSGAMCPRPLSRNWHTFVIRGPRARTGRASGLTGSYAKAAVDRGFQPLAYEPVQATHRRQVKPHLKWNNLRSGCLAAEQLR
jgi:hypothetical protein